MQGDPVVLEVKEPEETKGRGMAKMAVIGFALLLSTWA